MIEATLREIIKAGIVSSVNPDSCSVRVTFEDTDNAVSYDLPVLQQKTHKDKFYSLPDVGESVLCLFLQNGPQVGFVLGSFYNAQDVVPDGINEDVYCKEFEDGTRLEYDRKEHKLKADVKGTVEIEAEDDITIKSAKSLHIDTGSALNIKTSASVTVDSPNVTIDSNNVNLGGLAGMGVVTQQSTCAFTGGPHPVGSTKVKAVM